MKVSEWCDLWGMKLNASKTKTMIVSRSCTMHPQSPPLTIGSTVLKESDDLVILGVLAYSVYYILIQKYLYNKYSLIYVYLYMLININHIYIHIYIHIYVCVQNYENVTMYYYM